MLAVKFTPIHGSLRGLSRPIRQLAGGGSYGNLRRNKETRREKIRVEVAERRRQTQLFGGNPAVGFAPFPSAGRKTLDPFPQIRRGHWIGIDTDVLREEAREGFQTSAFQTAVGVFKCSDQQRKTCDETQGGRRVAIHEGRHRIELAFAEQEHVGATRKKRINTTQQVGDFWTRLFGFKRSRREAEDANRCGVGLPQFLVKLLNACGQQLSMNQRMSGIHVFERSWREYNGFLVQNFVGRNSGIYGGEEHGLGKSLAHEVCQERGAIPSSEGGAAKIHEIDFDSLLNDVLCQAFQEGFLRL